MARLLGSGRGAPVPSGYWTRYASQGIGAEIKQMLEICVMQHCTQPKWRHSRNGHLCKKHDKHEHDGMLDTNWERLYGKDDCRTVRD